MVKGVRIKDGGGNQVAHTNAKDIQAVFSSYCGEVLPRELMTLTNAS